MKKSIEDILDSIENDWDKRQGFFWRIRNKIVYKFMRRLYDKSAPQRIPDPSIDEESEIFSYFAKPNMQLGLPGEPYATRVDYNGQLDMGFGESGGGQFILYTGDPMEPVNERIWTLTKGYLPEINYDVVREGIECHIRAFQFWLEESTKQIPINFIQIDAENSTSQSKEIFLYCGYLHTVSKYKIFGIKKPEFEKKWGYGFGEDNEALRDQKVIYVPGENQAPISNFSKLTLNPKLDTAEFIPYEGEFTGKDLDVEEFTPILLQKYRIKLAPGQKVNLIFKIPQYPIDHEEISLIKKLKEADLEKYRRYFLEFWEGILSKCTRIEVPEKKVTHTSKASLVYNFMCQNYHKDGRIEQHVNRFQYNDFWIRDSSFYSKMYSMFNQLDTSKRLLRHFLTKQTKNGNFMSQKGQLDGFGQSLWAFGEYLKLSGDLDFAKEIFDPMMEAIDWFEKTIEKDEWGIMPPVFAADNEMISGRYTGHNLWAWHGLENAVYMAKLLNKQNALLRIQKIKQKFIKHFHPIFDKICEKHKNRVPPGLDTDLGEDWSNLLLIYPLKVLDPKDPKIKTTLESYRTEKMPEGIATWMVFQHHYITERIAQQNLLLDNQELALRDLYSMLSHTGSCHEGFEHNIKPWGNRHYLMSIRVLFLRLDFYNYPPHGWFATNYNLLLRNMLIREEDNTLHLFSALSPEWIKGDIIIKNANTYFGLCHLTLKALEENKVSIEFLSKFERNSPETLLFHIPYFIEKSSIHIQSPQDYEYNRKDGIIIFTPESKITFEIEWKMDPSKDLSYLSYEKAVNWLKSEYKRRFILNRK